MRSTSRRPDHPAEIAAGKQVDVQLRHLLAGVATVVGQDAIARTPQPEVAPYLADRAHEPDDLGVAGLLGTHDEGDIATLRDHPVTTRGASQVSLVGKRVAVKCG